MKPSLRLANGLVISVLVVVADQAVKAWILEHVMLPPRVIEVTSFFNLVLTWNRGVSFGLFNNESPYNAWVLPLIAVGIVGMLLAWMARNDDRLVRVCLGLIIGGAVGNLIDRIRFGAVADFLDFHVWGWHWPAFNIADSAISIGVALLIAESLFSPGERRKRDTGPMKESG